MIKLKTATGETIYVNPSHIMTLTDKKHYTEMVLVGLDYYQIQETPEKILKLIQKSNTLAEEG